MWRAKVWCGGYWLWFVSWTEDIDEAKTEIEAESVKFYQDWMRNHNLGELDITIDELEVWETGPDA